jgi:hypothetical protein
MLQLVKTKSQATFKNLNMNPIYAHYINEEEDRQRQVELNLERQFLRSRVDPFNLPDREFRKLFRVNKVVYEILVEQLTTHMQPRQRQTKLSANTRILAALRFSTRYW